VRPNPPTRPPRRPIPKPAKSPPLPEPRPPRLRNPGHLRRGGRGTSNSTPSRKLAWFCSGPLAGFYFGVGITLSALTLHSVPRSVPLIASFDHDTGGHRGCFAEQSLRFAFKDLLRSEPVRLLAYGANAEVFNENAKSITFGSWRIAAESSGCITLRGGS
jgi:hypothetical protein